MMKSLFVAACWFLCTLYCTAQTPKDLGNQVNTSFENYFPCLSLDEQTLFFTVRGQTEQDYSHVQEDVYWSKRDASGAWGKSYPLSLIDDHDDEGSVSLSADGKYLFFVVSNKKGDFGSADLYYIYSNHGQWSSPIHIGSEVNTSYWESTPSVSPDLKTLYFSSNRPGGFGKKDLWEVSIDQQANGTLHFGTPTNMGDQINTSGDELAPFAHADGKHLYFSSTEHQGHGGLDVFRLTADSTGKWGALQNLGDSINSDKDEVGFVITASGDEAYFSSNRWSDNRRLYCIQLPKNVQADPVYYVKGQTIDAKTKQPISAKVSLSETDSATTLLTTSILATGNYFLSLPFKSSIVLCAQKEGYLFSSSYLTVDSLKSTGFKHDIYLYPIAKGERLILNNINFDRDDYQLKASSETELSFLITLLKDNPSLSIELGGYTDSQGDEKHNAQLSEHRAVAVLNYLLKQGIDANRLKAVGYGEKNPIDTNDTEQGRAKNRRTEIKIL